MVHIQPHPKSSPRRMAAVHISGDIDNDIVHQMDVIDRGRGQTVPTKTRTPPQSALVKQAWVIKFFSRIVSGPNTSTPLYPIFSKCYSAAYCRNRNRDTWYKRMRNPSPFSVHSAEVNPQLIPDFPRFLTRAILRMVLSSKVDCAK